MLGQEPKEAGVASRIFRAAVASNLRYEQKLRQFVSDAGLCCRLPPRFRPRVYQVKRHHPFFPFPCGHFCPSWADETGNVIIARLDATTVLLRIAASNHDLDRCRPRATPPDRATTDR